MKLRGFTLIELLVVIAIIGLLGTLSVVSFTTSREKARLARANSASSQALRALGDDAQLIWEFSDCAGTTITDRSGNNNHGVITNATWSTDSHDGTGCSLNLSGNTAFFTSSKPLRIPRNSMTVSAWFKTTANADQFVVGDNAGTIIALYQNHVRFCVAAAYCTPTAYSPGMKVVNDGKWHLATIVGDSQSVRMYVDGSSVMDISGNTSANTGNTTVYSVFTGLVDDIFIFNRALTAQEVHKRYVEELERSQIANR